MARIKLSPIISEIKGKIGNIVFQGGRSGIIIRERVVPRNRSTPAQTRSRTILTRVKGAWQTLTTTQRSQWLSLASYFNKPTKFNAQKVISAYELFIQHNTIRIQGNYDILESTTSEIQTVTQTNITFQLRNDGRILFDAGISPIDDIDNIAVYISRPFRGSAAIPKSEARFFISSSNEIETRNIAEEYLEKYNVRPVAGQKILFKIVGFQTNSGWVSKPFFIEQIVANSF